MRIKMYSTETEQDKVIRSLMFNEESIKELEFEISEMKHKLSILQTALTNVVMNCKKQHCCKLI